MTAQPLQIPCRLLHQSQYFQNSFRKVFEIPIEHWHRLFQKHIDELFRHFEGELLDLKNSSMRSQDWGDWILQQHALYLSKVSQPLPIRLEFCLCSIALSYREARQPLHCQQFILFLCQQFILFLCEKCFYLSMYTFCKDPYYINFCNLPYWYSPSCFP